MPTTPWRTFTWIGLLLIAIVSPSGSAFAKDILLTYGERVTVYSGPGLSYRPLVIVPSGTELPTASTTIKNKNGEFYKVLVQLSDKKRVVGYVPIDAELRKKSDRDPGNDMESFKEYPRAQRSVQFSYSHFKTRRSLATSGLLKYVGPGFYLKGFGGVFQSPGNSSPLIGAEFGNDAPLDRRLSGFASFALGVLLNPKEDALFEGNKKNFSNFLVQTAMGLRYHFGEIASLSVGGTQAAIVSANNSLVTFGGLVTLEWGL